LEVRQGWRLGHLRCLASPKPTIKEREDSNEGHVIRLLLTSRRTRPGGSFAASAFAPSTPILFSAEWVRVGGEARMAPRLPPEPGLTKREDSKGGHFFCLPRMLSVVRPCGRFAESALAPSSPIPSPAEWVRVGGEARFAGNQLRCLASPKTLSKNVETRKEGICFAYRKCRAS
jgi:hypothetical protein